VNTIFAPLPDEIAWARQVVAAYEQAAGEGRGAFAVNGRMIDAANLRLANTTLDRVRAIEGRATGAAR